MATHGYSDGHRHDHREGPDAVRLIEQTFIEGFRAAVDKRAFLELAGVPFSLTGDAGGASSSPLRLIEVRIADGYVVGAAAPAFGARELAYQPLPGSMVERSTALTFVYVSIDERRELSAAEVLAAAHANRG